MADESVRRMKGQLLIAGGGIAGLTCALASAQAGWRIELLEQSLSFAEFGAGIQLGPNVTRRLRALGLEWLLAPLVFAPRQLQIREARRGQLLADMALADDFEARYGAPYWCVHRVDLHGSLLSTLRRSGLPVNVNLGARVQRVVPGGEQISVASTDDRIWQGDGLIGADGLWSQVHGVVCPGTPPPRASGHRAWRALVAQAVLPAALRSDAVQVWLAPWLHAVAYPVRGGEWLNLVLLAESPRLSAAADASDARDWDQQISLEHLQHAVRGLGGTLRALLEAVPDWRAWTLCARPPLQHAWQMAHGRIALTGDAAHPMLPYLAQGAGMAIEDATLLGRLLQDSAAAALPHTLAQYAQQRWQRSARVQAGAIRNGRIFHQRAPLRWGRDLALRLLGRRLLDQPWLYRE